MEKHIWDARQSLTGRSAFSSQQGGPQVAQQTSQMANQQQMPCQQSQQVQGGPVTAGPYVSWSQCNKQVSKDISRVVICMRTVPLAPGGGVSLIAVNDIGEGKKVPAITTWITHEVTRSKRNCRNSAQVESAVWSVRHARCGLRHLRSCDCSRQVRLRPSHCVRSLAGYLLTGEYLRL